MSADDQVSDARRVRLDPDRQAVALRRIATNREVAQHHEALARAARAEMHSLTRTWQLCPRTRAVSPCCGDPEQCSGFDH